MNARGMWGLQVPAGGEVHVREQVVAWSIL
jgi:hypothetical protein